MCQCVSLSFCLFGFRLPCLQHVCCVAIKKDGFPVCYVASDLSPHIWDFGRRMVIKSTVSLSRRAFLTSLLNSAQLLCSRRGKSPSPSSFSSASNRKWRKKFRSKDIHASHLLSIWHRAGISWTCRFDFFPCLLNDHYDIKSEIASVGVNRIPSGQWLIFVHISLLHVSQQVFHPTQPSGNLLYLHACVCIGVRLPVVHARGNVYPQSKHEGRAVVVEALKVISFLSFFFPSLFL